MTGRGHLLAKAVIEWQKYHGRHELPWQKTQDPYRVWLSEIMLQQTQVVTVVGYFARFLDRFPNVAALAQASLDEVLGLWSGLGYYSRARNLHVCAQIVMADHAGKFPNTAQQLQSLPGIGQSTAAAIASLCFGERVAILDGNVKRVLTRYLGFGADLAQAGNQRRLWQLAQAALPVNDLLHQMPRYTQGMMDLGATVCTTHKPACAQCPLQQQCVANADGSPHGYPVNTRSVLRSAQSLWLLWARSDQGALWLWQRPTPGVWAGLYSFALFDSYEELELALPGDRRQFVTKLPSFKHALTHKELHLHPVQVLLAHGQQPACDGDWFESSRWQPLGMPAPVAKLLRSGS